MKKEEYAKQKFAWNLCETAAFLRAPITKVHATFNDQLLDRHSVTHLEASLAMIK